MCCRSRKRVLIIISCVLIFEIAQFVTDNRPPRRGRLESEFDNGTVQSERGNKTALHSPEMEVECWSWNTGRIDFVWCYSYYYYLAQDISICQVTVTWCSCCADLIDSRWLPSSATISYFYVQNRKVMATNRFNHLDIEREIYRSVTSFMSCHSRFFWSLKSDRIWSIVKCNLANLGENSGNGTGLFGFHIISGEVGWLVGLHRK